jgi:tRNA splicing endonuclease
LGDIIPMEKLHLYLVFKHFWMRGLYVSFGANYGGQFLVYSGLLS